MPTHHLDDACPHAFWDNAFPPRLSIHPGDTVVFETLEGSGQITPAFTAADFGLVDPDRVHALTGPVAVEGAEPGDTLVVEILGLKHKGWGWSAIIPEFGLLAEDFTEPHIHHFKLEGDTCVFKPGIHIPFEPFCGVMGVAPAELGRLDTTPPRLNAGNIDIRHLTAGTRVYLPVLHPGALFSCGDWIRLSTGPSGTGTAAAG